MQKNWLFSISCTVKIMVMTFSIVGADFQKAIEFYKKGDFDKAIVGFKKELEKINPNVKAYYCLSVLLGRGGDTLIEALSYAELLEDYEPFLSMKGQASLHNKLGHFLKAHKFYEKAFELNQGDLDVRNEVYKGRLRLGRYQQTTQFSDIETYRLLLNGSLYGKRILIRLTQGFGDQLMYVRFARSLRSLGANIVVMVKENLVPLLQLTGYVDEFVFEQDEPLGEFDYILNSCIGTLMVASHEMPIDHSPYLRSSEDLKVKWHDKLSSDLNFKVGVFWQGSFVVDSFGNRRPGPRGIALDELKVLSEIKGVSFYSLQQVNPFNTIEEVRHAGINVFDTTLDVGYGSFMETAAVIEQMDLVISSDSSIAHLAGGLGKPVWVMLPLESDYRWLLDSNETFWYPSMRLYRSKLLNSSLGILSAMKEDLIELVKDSSSFRCKC